MLPFVDILDCGTDLFTNWAGDMPHDGRVLLDGSGRILPRGGKPVYLRFWLGDVGTARNSRGDLIEPNITADTFIEYAESMNRECRDLEEGW